MLFSTALLGVFVQLAALTVKCQANCGNNCGRAVAGTAAFKLPLAARSADCSSFMLVYTTQTVTPDVSTIYFGTTQTAYSTTVTVVSTSTSTITTTTTMTTGVAGPVKRGDVLAPRSAGAIPTYATACLNADAYVSACACLGVSVAPTSTIRTTLPAVVTSATTTQTNFAATTTFTTTTVLTTTTVTVHAPAYSQVGGPYDGCGILHYSDWIPNQSLTDKTNVQAGTDFCIQQCNARPACTEFYQQWQYNSYWACWVAENYAFSPSDLQCNVPSNPYGLAYAWQNNRI